MEALNLSQVGQTNFTNKQEIEKETPKAPEQKKNGAKLLASGAAAGAAIAIAGLALTGKIGKAKEVAQDGISKLQDVKFFHGEAYSKVDGMAFSGIISDTLKNGDAIKMVYKDGILQKSERKGTKNVLKSFEYWDDSCKPLKKVITKRQGDTTASLRKYHINGRLAEFDVEANDGANAIRFRTYTEGKAESLVTPEFIKRWDINGELSFLSKKITNLDGEEVKVSVFFDDGKINRIDYGAECATDRNNDGKLVIGRLCNKTTPAHIAEALEKLGIKDVPEIIKLEV